MNRHYFSAYAGLPREVYYLFTAKLINCFGMFIMPLLTLILTQKLGLSLEDAGGKVSLLILTQAPCVILGGKLADSFGRKKTFLLGSFAGAFFYLLCATGLTGKAMVYCIILAADMIALAAPSMDAMLADFTLPEQRQSAFSLLYLGTNIGMAASPIVGGLLFNQHLPLLFLLDAVTTIAGAVVLLLKVQEKYVATRKATADTAEKPKGISLAGALKSAPILLLFILLLFLFDFCYSQWDFMLPAQFGDFFGASGAQLYSILCSANAVTVILLTPLITRLTQRFSALVIMGAGGILFAMAYLGFGFCNAFPVFLLMAEIFTLGEITTTIQIGAFLSTHVPTACQGRITAFSTFVRGSAKAIGPLVMGKVLLITGYSKGWYLIAAIALMGSLGMYCSGRSRWNHDGV